MLNGGLFSPTARASVKLETKWDRLEYNPNNVRVSYDMIYCVNPDIFLRFCAICIPDAYDPPAATSRPRYIFVYLRV